MTYQIHDLSFGYTTERVIDGVALDIGPGEFISIIGPNGAGKSTLLGLMAGLLRGFRGSIEFFSRPLSGYRPNELSRRLAFVPQETHVVFPFTAVEMVLMGMHSQRSGFMFDTSADVAAVGRAMGLTGTEHLGQRTFNELSGGEKQRVVLASALVQQPDVLILDEPTVYLDLKHQLGLYRILERLNEGGMTVIAATHDVNLAAHFARRLVVLANGRIIRAGAPKEILTNSLFEEIFEVGAHIVTRPEGGPYVIPAV